MPSRAQSTARGEVFTYNAAENTLIFDLDESDLRYNLFDLSGGIVSLSMNNITHEAYYIPAERVTSPTLTTSLRVLGADPQRDNINLVLVVAKSSSALHHLGGDNPATTFEAHEGDEVRVSWLSAFPTPVPVEINTQVVFIQPDGDIRTSITDEQAAAQGLFVGISGTISLNGQERAFLMVNLEEYYVSGAADIYVYLEPSEVEGSDVEYLTIAPVAPARGSLNISGDFALGTGAPISLQYQSFVDTPQSFTGQVVDIQADGQQLITDVPDSYLDELGVRLGGYAVVAVNGVVRGAMVMDETLFVNALQPGGVSSNYVLLRQTGILKLIYMLGDGRTAQGIFNAQIGSPVRIRPAQAVESIVREEAVVKAVAEIDPDGYLIIDVSPFELSYLQVLVGQYVDININGISYRSRVVDDSLLGSDPAGDDIWIYPSGDHSIITHTPDNTITAEARFQASIGDVVVIQRAPN
jgi:hypothetical protein